MTDIQPTHQWSASPPIRTPPPPSTSPSNNAIPDDVLNSLQRHSLFQRSNNQQFLERIACSMNIRTYSPHDVIIVEGEQAKAMFLLLRGKVNVCSADFERIYATLDPGTFFGEIGLLYAIPRTATVIAATQCTVAVLTAEAVSVILPDYPAVERILRFEAQERMAMLDKMGKGPNNNEYNNDSASSTLSTPQSNSRRSSEDLRRTSSVTAIDSFITTSAYDHLTKVPFFKDCPEDFLHRISLKVEPRNYRPNTMIINKGDIGREMYFIVDGTVQILNRRPEGDLAVARLGPMDFFGELSLLLDIPRTASVQSITPIEMYVLSKEDCLEVCHDYPDIESQFKILADKTLRTINKLNMSIGDFGDQQVDTVSGGVVYVPAEEQDYGASLAPIDRSAICSTTSDQDPTLPPPTKANQIRSRETRPRRPSIAVWSDPSLLAVASMASTCTPTSPTSKRRSVTIKEETYALELTLNQRDRFTALDTSIIARIATLLDFASLIRLSSASRKLYRTLHKQHVQAQQIDLGSSNRLMTDDTIGLLIDLIGANVESLYLTHCYHLTDQAIIMIAQNAPHLRKLDLNSCWLITDRSLDSLRSLQWLDLSNCRKITDNGMLHLLENNTNLQHLTLSYCKNLTDQTMLYFAQHCTQDLQYLNLQRCTKITDQGFVHWLNQAPNAFCALHTLNLTDCSFLTDRAIAHLIVAAPYLNDLSISFCCALSDTSLEELAKLEQLEALDASYCGSAVSDASIITLLKGTSQTIHRLNIRGCVRISGIGLMTGMEYAKHLKYVNISQCPGISPQVRTCIARSGHIDGSFY
ncbi:hypothetical protein BDA99DRAFT_464372 [Phascolomyces articulosus]|uniref:Cyclic nucleotide-binding domain-containing protein n=1 Tax=Phascolomyces articulosus TaxID=60185 RepID=A0AAD5JZ24_9FUNG|nr:hypothetical protein BDA99DRAFT_464372 [Phascolomyces articulosus]